MSEPTGAGGAALGAEQSAALDGVLPSQALNRAIEAEWVSSGDYRIRPEAIQPASIDLRLGDFAWALRCSFLPDVDSTVEEKIEGLAFQKVDLRDGAVLERDRPYLVPLIEELALPDDVRAKANPKSSTGRLDVFTRVITDRHHRFDDIRAGYRGKLYLEIVPRSFAIQVQDRALAQPAAPGPRRRPPRRRRDPRPPGRVPAALPRLARAARSPSWPSPTASSSASTSPAPADRTVGYRAKKNSLPVDLSRIRAYRWTDYWDPVFPEAGRPDRARAGDLLPAALRRGRLHPAADRRRDDGLRPDRRRAAHPLRRLLRPRLRLRPGAAAATAAAPRSRCAPATSPSWSSTASRSASSASSGWRPRPSASTAPTSAPTTRAR